MTPITFTIPVCPQALQTSGNRLVMVAGKPRFFKNPKAQVYLDAIDVLAERDGQPRIIVSIEGVGRE